MDRGELNSLARWVIRHHSCVYNEWCRHTERVNYPYATFARFILRKHPEMVVAWRLSQ